MHARRALLVAALFFVSFPAFAATYYIPDHYGAIQAGLDAAAGGDTLIVRDGVYTGAGNKNLDFKGKALTLRSENGPEACVIDCEGAGSGVSFRQGETDASVLDGFTITNASNYGVYISHSSPRVTNCIITHNSNAYSGGGLACFSSSPTITDCVITDNIAGTMGGGIACYWSSPTIIDCAISANTAVEAGGIYCYSSAPSIINCVISENSATFAGGIDCYNNSSATIVNCMVNRNTAFVGGGINCYTSAPTITNCTVVENSSANGGGVSCLNSSSPNIRNCTISANLADDGGAIRSVGSSSPIIIDSILWSDSATNRGPEISLFENSSLTVSYSDVEGGQAAAYVESGCALNWGSGNVEADPLFVGNSDYHLTPGSPCIDTGTDAGVYDDIDGDIRPQGAQFDIGADEFAPPPSLSQVSLQSPIDGSILSAPPTFAWTADAGENNAYALDFSLQPLFPFWSTYENMSQIIYDATWTMPPQMWEEIPAGKPVYWRVRGADLNLTPLTVITSDEVWSFYKHRVRVRR